MEMESTTEHDVKVEVEDEYEDGLGICESSDKTNEMRQTVKDLNILEENVIICRSIELDEQKGTFNEEFQIKEEKDEIISEPISEKMIEESATEESLSTSDIGTIKEEVTSNDTECDTNDLEGNGVEKNNLQLDVSYLSKTFDTGSLMFKEELEEVEDKYNVNDSFRFGNNCTNGESNNNENEVVVSGRNITSERGNEESNNSNEPKPGNETDATCLSVRFQVNRSTIETVSKENQASELQNLEGLSVYDQTTLETGIMLQVDQALEQGIPDQSQSATSLEPDEDETEMERQIRLGEMTPFGTSLGEKSTTPTIKPIDGLSVIEKYLRKQLELQGKKKRNKVICKKSTASERKKEAKPDKENKQDPLKKRILHRKEKKNKKKRKEVMGTETEDYIPWTNKPGLVAGEKAYMYPEDASGSEYVPSDSDYIPSSEEDIKHMKILEKKQKSPENKRKRKLEKMKSYKIPEDWNSEDSDWEYSDEEGNMKKNKKRKKELDDGDVDVYSRRLQFWKHERRRARTDQDLPQFHELNDDLKMPQDIWSKLYNYQRVGVQWLWELDQQRCGGILGDEMGLGKTIQVVAFLASLHVSDIKDKDTKYRGLGPTLIVCPTTVMHQWVREFHQWYPPLRVAILHETGTFCGKQRSRLISNMAQAGGVLITSYTGATQHKEDITTRRWHYVILDEGHKIRNPDAQITLVVKQLQTTHRIILTGSPMQNNLKELWSLFDFVFPGKLGTLPVFLEQFAVPITQGGYANASQIQVRTAFKCATVLKDTMAPYLLRRMKADVKSHVRLPEKNEQVLFCRLTDEQRHYYKDYVESGEVSRILEGRLKIFMGLINLRKICNHPDLYVGRPKDEEDLPEEERYGHWSKSGKMIVVETILKLWQKQGHRVLVFTQSRQMLSIMEAFVRQANYKYLKLDGATSIAARQPLINKFNQDTSYFVMLLTTRVGGLGVNLTGANRVLIYDPDWNPATDTQARERAWRIGQKQSVTVYRLITAGTIEEKMYHRQIFKQFLCNKVLKDPRQRRFFKSNDLFELFTLKETDVEGSTETGAIFAGTGSEVKLDPTKTYKHRKVDPKLSAKPPLETFARKKAEKKKMLEEISLKKNQEKNNNTPEGDVSFSTEKIEHMKKLAQMLSQKIIQNTSSEKTNSAVEIKNSGVNAEDITTISDNETSINKVDLSVPSTSTNSEILLSSETPTKNSVTTETKTNNDPGPSEQSSNNKTHKHKSKHKDKKKKKDAKFEGERVPHLVRAGTSSSHPEVGNEEEGENYATQDEYVLQKLFARSGLQTALQHDTIMEGGPADYVLVESEADKVAQQAVERLKESQRECWQASSGIPNFTGQNGARNFQPRMRFGNKKSSLADKSSCDLLELIRKRNGIREVKDPEIALVQDIRDFVSTQGGTVHTTQLIDRFEGRLPEGSSPLFKSLLGKICKFYRAPDGLGYWTLKEEFNW